MFWKRWMGQRATNANALDASEIASEVGRVYADLTKLDRLIKPRSALPCSWFAVRECFMTAYEAEYLQLPERVQNSFHHVYRELAFFVDDNLCHEFNASLEIAVRCRVERYRAKGYGEDEYLARKYIASTTVVMKDRKEIWERLGEEETCPRHDLLLLAETLTYCGGLYRAMHDEWAFYANLITHRKKPEGGN